MMHLCIHVLHVGLLDARDNERRPMFELQI